MSRRIFRFTATLMLMLIGSPLLLSVVVAEEAPVGEEPDLPLGLRLTEALHAIIEEHKEAIRSAILEYRLRFEELIENKTRLIEDFIEERLNRTRQIREAMEELRGLYAAGNITREEYLSRLSELRSELKALTKLKEKLGKLLQEFAAEMREIVREKVERLREINKEFGERVSEEARRIRERVRELRGPDEVEESNSTSTASAPAQESGRGDGRPSTRANSTTTNEEDSSQRGGEGEHGGEAPEEWGGNGERGRGRGEERARGDGRGEPSARRGKGR
ncbi:MAG: hypothetical protein NZ938_04080 [Aigarchaeota archaeon]|nr:hypothetical protein [Candidatus Calditenuaceae archaeon]